MEKQSAGLSAEFFKGNRTALRELFTGRAPIVITANGLLQRSGDTTLPFQQDSNFWYLTGLDHPDLILVIDRTKEYIILPDRRSNQIIFDGAWNSDQLSRLSGVTMVLDHKTGWKLLSTRLKRAKYAATLAASPAYSADHGFYTNPARASLIYRMKEINAEIELLDLRDHLVKLRAVKQPAEIAVLQRAVDLTVDTLKSVIRRRRSLNTETAIEAAISHNFRLNHAAHGYQPIVAGGLNACTLHYITNNAKLRASQLVLIDVGAEIDHYSADITRTYALKPPTKRQQTVYDTVLEIQAYCLRILKPGIKLRAYEQAVNQMVGEKLRELGLIKSINPEEVHRYYPHATSHFLGLDVHDVGKYDQPLAPGMVLTVEPGIYVPEEKLGVRIEDDILITADGIEVLSAKLPKTLW